MAVTDTRSLGDLSSFPKSFQQAELDTSPSSLNSPSEPQCFVRFETPCLLPLLFQLILYREQLLTSTLQLHRPLLVPSSISRLRPSSSFVSTNPRSFSPLSTSRSFNSLLWINNTSFTSPFSPPLQSFPQDVPLDLHSSLSNSLPPQSRSPPPLDLIPPHLDQRLSHPTSRQRRSFSSSASKQRSPSSPSPAFLASSPLNPRRRRKTHQTSRRRAPRKPFHPRPSRRFHWKQLLGWVLFSELC